MGIFDRLKTLSSQKPSPAVAVAATGPALPKKVLIVEDDKVLAAALEAKFSSAGFLVLLAENGQAGLEQVTAQKPNIILLDLMMPVMDGLTMLRHLRDIPEFKSLPVIVLTNAGTTDNMTETKTLYNASDFLIKSNVSPEDILAKVRQLIL